MNAGREPDLHVSHASCTASLYIPKVRSSVYILVYIICAGNIIYSNTTVPCKQQSHALTFNDN